MTLNAEWRVDYSKMLLGQGTYKEKRQNFMPTQLLT